jgi:hypothetical protein
MRQFAAGSLAWKGGHELQINVPGGRLNEPRLH